MTMSPFERRITQTFIKDPLNNVHRLMQSADRTPGSFSRIGKHDPL